MYSYYTVSQVPELARLQDHSKTARVRHYKHRVDLMYRASRNNEDRTNILIHNNPPPEVASLDTDQDGVGRYLPSWMDDSVSDREDQGNLSRSTTLNVMRRDVGLRLFC